MPKMYLFCTLSAMKTVTFHLLVNLSVSDLLITCLCGPVHVINSLAVGKKIGKKMVKNGKKW